MAVKLTVSWNLTVVYMLCISFREFSPFIFLSPSVDLRNFTGITFYFFSTLAQFSSVQIFSLSSSLLFSYVHHARCSWIGERASDNEMETDCRFM